MLWIINNNFIDAFLLWWMLHLVSGLECWQCIADDCNQPPDANYKATRITCTNGASCQKVDYYGHDTASTMDITSVIRSCSQGVCVPHTDNCTERLLANPGCMIRHCCHDDNLCNGAMSVKHGLYEAIPIVITTICGLYVLPLLSCFTVYIGSR